MERRGRKRIEKIMDDLRELKDEPHIDEKTIEFCIYSLNFMNTLLTSGVIRE